MGTGVGEAMLIGAMTGAGTSAVTGGDPLKGALLGAAGGGIGAGVAGAGTGALAPTATSTGVQTGISTGSQLGSVAEAANLATAAPTQATSVGLGQGLSAPSATGLSPNLVAGSGFPTTTFQASPEMAGHFAKDVGASQMGTAGSPTFPNINQFYARNPIMMPAGLGATAAAIGGGYDREGPPGKEKYSGPLSRFRYDPDEYTPYMASGGLADSAVAKKYMRGGHLGAYSDGGRLTKGPGDGMSDDIPAKIGAKQPARLADGEFVIPADVVSGIGNGSTDAGARKLYAMMDKVRKARTGTKRQGKEINPSKYMPA
jgi:hypothetical protein